MSNRLEEIKNEVILKYAEDSFKDSGEYLASLVTENDVFNEICKTYAKECCEASLEKASEKAIAIYDGNFLADVDKESITNPDNIVIL